MDEKGGEGQKGLSHLKRVMHPTNDKTWHSYNLAKKDPKNI